MGEGTELDSYSVISHEKRLLLLNNKVRKVKVESLSRVRLFATPWTVSYQAPPSVGFSRQEYWSGMPFPSPGHLPSPGIEPRSPALQAYALPFEPPEKPVVSIYFSAAPYFSPPFFSPPPCPHNMSILYICISLPTLKIGSPAPFL